MAKRNENDYIVGLDIGTSKVVALISRFEEGELHLYGYGVARNSGMRKGAVTNLEVTQEAISSAIEQADMMSGLPIEHAFVSVGGGHIKGFNSRGSYILPENRHTISAEDIAHVIGAARAVAIPSDREVIHLLPQEFVVDDEQVVEDPLGYSARKIEVGVHLVTGSQMSIKNFISCTQEAGLEVKDIVLSQFASSLSTLTEDEKEMGVAVIDIGGGTTDLAIYLDGYLWHTAVLTLAGDQITSDISIGLRTPVPEAERIKTEKGACFKENMDNPDEAIDVTTIGEGKNRVIDNTVLVEIIQARCDEILRLVKTELERVGVHNRLNAGVVLTGGTANLRGITALAEQVFENSVRVAVPTGFAGIIDAMAKPEFSTVTGLVRFGFENRKTKPKDLTWAEKIMKKIKSLF